MKYIQKHSRYKRSNKKPGLGIMTTDKRIIFVVICDIDIL